MPCIRVQHAGLDFSVPAEKGISPLLPGWIYLFFASLFQIWNEGEFLHRNGALCVVHLRYVVFGLILVDVVQLVHSHICLVRYFCKFDMIRFLLKRFRFMFPHPIGKRPLCQPDINDGTCLVEIQVHVVFLLAHSCSPRYFLYNKYV